jgi:hypothetical protein
MRRKIFEVSIFPKAYQKVLSSESVEVIIDGARQGDRY